MQTLLQNLRFSLRMLAKNPGLTFTVLLTLALGIGANTAIFTVDYATLLAPMPYPEPDQLVMVWSKIQTYHNSVSAGDFTDWKRQSTAFQDLNAFSGSGFNIATKDQPQLIQGRLATTGFFQMMGQGFFLGAASCPRKARRGKTTSSCSPTSCGSSSAPTLTSLVPPCPWMESLTP
jgi:putative ABC transport system permease protein